MTDLAKWLLEQIAEDELTAKRALAGHPATAFDMSNAYMTRVWRARYHEVVARMTQEPTPQQLAVFLPGVNPRVEKVADCGPANVYPAKHIAAWDPARVLAECDAKRRAMARSGPFCDCGEHEQPMDPDTNWIVPIPHHYDCSAYEAAKIFSVVYADRPGYREEWRP